MLQFVYNFVFPTTKSERKKCEKKNEVEQVKRSFQDEPWQNMFLSLALKFAQTGLYLNWIGLDGSHPVCWMLHLLHFYCIDFIFGVGCSI